MLILRTVLWMISAGLMTLGAGVVFGQNYPNKPLRIVTGDAGGGLNIPARLIAPALAASLGQQVIVDNRGGAGGAIAIETAAKATPDGYTVLLYGSSVWLLPLMQKTPSWDPLKDFAPITLATSAPHILVVHPSVAVNSVKELIALAKSKPGKLNYASAGPGSTPHLAAELFKAMARVSMVQISYKGNGAALNSIIGSETHLMFSNVPPGLPFVKSGRLRALAVTSARPSALVPGLPTLASAGLPGFQSGSMIGIFAPAKTPLSIVKRLNQEFVRILQRPDMKKRLFNAGLEVVGSSPAELIAAAKAESARLSKVIKDIGFGAK